MAYQRITKKTLVERWNRTMKKIGHGHFCVPCSEYKIACYRDMLHYAEVVVNGFDDDFRDGYDDYIQFYQDKAKAKRLLDWLKNAPKDIEFTNELI